MSNDAPPDTGQPLGADELRVMFRAAGLSIADDRLLVMLAELTTQLAFGRTLDPLLDGVEVGESTFAPFDPAWPAPEPGGASR